MRVLLCLLCSVAVAFALPALAVLPALWLAGVQYAGPSAMQRFNVVTSGASASRIDFLSALRLARKV